MLSVNNLFIQFSAIQMYFIFLSRFVAKMQPGLSEIWTFNSTSIQLHFLKNSSKQFSYWKSVKKIIYV